MEEKILEILKKRIKLFEKLIKEEDNQIKRLKYKSRRIRHASPSNNRANWYIDRKQELQLVLKLLEGTINEVYFIHCLLDDEAGVICTTIGNYSVQD